MTPIAHTGLEVLTNAEMSKADEIAVNSGVPFLTLMENAGRAVAVEAVRLVPLGARIQVLCGPGNNGGDGFVAARLLRERGHHVGIACLVPIASLKGAAAAMAGRCATPISENWPEVFGDETALIIDAIFGAGLSRPAEGDFASAIELINQCRDDHGIPVLAVDVPSGLDGDTGEALGHHVVRATHTVTFFRKKPGHLLLPGRALCGALTVADIGIPDDIFDDMYFGDESAILCPRVSANAPKLWRTELPRLRTDGHKYTRGHAVVVSGGIEMSGAARLCARGALRIGAGLVTVATPPDALQAHAAQLNATLLKTGTAARELSQLLGDKRFTATAIGPGLGRGEGVLDQVMAVLAAGTATVLDADAITVAAAAPADLFQAIASIEHRPVVLTPHEGEFKRLFPSLAGSKLERARAAAKLSGATIVLKGPDTVIAAPDGRAAINDNAPPTLATAGSGDVLAGFVTGLLAQGMPAFEAACAAVWLHGECANAFGPGLIAEDLPEALPGVLARLGSHNV